jgi:hypothetical protein
VSRRGAAVAATALCVLAVVIARARAATPESVNLTPSSPTTAFTTSLIGGVGLDGSNCQEDVSCDTVGVVLQPGDYSGKNLRIAIDWLVPADDFDVYVFRDGLGGPAVGAGNGPAPSTHEELTVSIDGVIATARRYVLHVVASTAAPEQVHGTLSFVAPPPLRHALDAAADVRFSPNVTVVAPGAPRDCEPSLRVDVRGNTYVGGIRGVPAGVDLWRFDLDPSSPTYDPQLRSPVYLGQPDAFAPEDTVGGRDGGGDIDIAVSFPNGAAVPALTIVSLAAANISSAVSADRGDHFALSPAVADVPADDRQWIEAQGDSLVYQMYRAPIPATGLWVQKSLDHGVSWGAPSLVSPTGTSPGYIDVDHADGTVYVAHTSSSALFVSRSTDGGTTWSTATVDNSTAHGSLFDPVKVGEDGTVYVAWSDEHNVHLAHSIDRGLHWSPPVRVNGAESQVALFPWLEAGSANRVALVWYGTSHVSNDDGADWRVHSAITLDATATDPHFHRAEVTDHVVHSSNISLGGLGVDTPLTPQPNRNLCDYFQVAIDPLGACVVAFTDDHNDFDGHTYLARQLAGPSLYGAANAGTGVLTPVDPLPPPTPDPAAPELADFLHDATGSSLQPVPSDNPFDLLSVDYRCEVQGAAPLIEVRFRVSDLSVTPANAFWRAYFTANAPAGAYERGEMFYVEASTDASATPSFRFGSVVRAHNGSYTLTPLGAATGGQILGATDEVVARLALGTLNAFVTGAAVGPGSRLVGLKANTGTSGAVAARDIVRGGGTFDICAELAGVTPVAAGTLELGRPRPNPASGRVALDVTLDRSEWVELGVFDAGGRRVRTVHAGVLPAGTTRLVWDGRSDGGRLAPAGAYWMRALAGGASQRQRMILVR